MSDCLLVVILLPSFHAIYFNIRQEVFAKLLRLPAQYYLDNSSGHITAKIMYNVEQLTAASTESLKTVLQQGMITIALLGYLLYTNWRLTAVILIFSMIGIIIRKASKRMRKLSVQVQDTMGCKPCGTRSRRWTVGC